MIDALSPDLLEMAFMRHALAAGLLASLACGVLGSLVVVNRVVLLTGGIAHAAYGGIGLAFFLGLAPLAGAVGFSLVAALIMAWAAWRDRHRADTIIGVMWAVGMALGVVLIDLSPGYNVDLMSYLFGSILAVPTLDLYLMAGLDVVILAVVGLWYRQFLALSFDQDFAASRGVPVRTLHTVLILLIALTVVLLIRVVGLILVIALVTIPPFVAEGWTRSLKGMMTMAAALCAAFSVIGLYLAYRFDLTSGPAIILVAGVFFFLSLPFRGRMRRGTASGGD